MGWEYPDLLAPTRELLEATGAAVGHRERTRRPDALD